MSISPPQVHAREIGQRYPPDPNALTGAPNVIRTGKSEIYPEIPRAILEAAAKDADHLRIIRDLKLESAMIVPLKTRDGRTLGAMSFIYAASGRRYSEDDLAFAEDFAQRATMAIENANAVRDLEAARAIEISLRKQAEIANTAKDEFLATVSHELRTPLNSILGWAVILRRWELTKEIDRGLEVIERNARAQARLIEDVLDVSRVISGKLSLTLGPVDVAGHRPRGGGCPTRGRRKWCQCNGWRIRQRLEDTHHRGRRSNSTNLLELVE